MSATNTANVESLVTTSRWQKKLDALDWASCISYNVLGLRVMVRVTSPVLAQDVCRLMRSFPAWPDNGQPPDVTFSLVAAPPAKTPTVRPFHFLYVDGRQAGRTHQQWQLFRYLECELDHMLAEKIASPLLLHSGAVSKKGVGILIPGASGSGKSSLTLALAQSGYNYYSDEIAVIDAGSAELQPFPKPFSIKDKSIFPDLAQQHNRWFGPESNVPEAVWYVHPEDLGAQVAEGSVPIGYIIFPTRGLQANAQLLPLSSGEALRQLVTNSINLHKSGNEGFHLLAELVSQAQCFSLESGDLETSVSLVSRLMETPD